MKPKNWQDLTQDEKYEIGNRLFGTLRGWYLINQALTIAIPALKKEPLPEVPFPERSTAEDMEILLETIFKSEPVSLVEVSIDQIVQD